MDFVRVQPLPVFSHLKGVIMCTNCNNTGLIGPSYDQNVCTCSDGREKWSHYKYSFEEEIYLLDPHTHLRNLAENYSV